MIDQNKNIYKDKFLKRIVETDPELRQITLHDSRYYQRSPGVSPVLLARLGRCRRRMVSGMSGFQSQAHAHLDGRIGVCFNAPGTRYMEC